MSVNVHAEYLKIRILLLFVRWQIELNLHNIVSHRFTLNFRHDPRKTLAFMCGHVRGGDVSMKIEFEKYDYCHREKGENVPSCLTFFFWWKRSFIETCDSFIHVAKKINIVDLRKSVRNTLQSPTFSYKTHQRDSGGFTRNEFSSGDIGWTHSIFLLQFLLE